MKIWCDNCDGSGIIGHAPDGRAIACESCGGHEDSRGRGYILEIDSVDFGHHLKIGLYWLSSDELVQLSTIFKKASECAELGEQRKRVLTTAMEIIEREVAKNIRA